MRQKDPWLKLKEREQKVEGEWWTAIESSKQKTEVFGSFFQLTMIFSAGVTLNPECT